MSGKHAVMTRFCFSSWQIAMITPYYEIPLSEIPDEHDCDGDNACPKDQVLHIALQLHTQCTQAHAKQA